MAVATIIPGVESVGRSKIAYTLLMKLWPLGKVLYWLSNRPVIGSLLQPCISVAGDEAIIIPVQEVVWGTESVVLPYPLLAPLVERASPRFLLNECMCRRGEHCQVYPRDLGCLFLGDGAAEIASDIGRPVDVDEALAHIQRAMEIGLVPLVIHAAFDAWILDVPYDRTLAICFCCDCCCTVRQGLRLGPPAFWDTVVRLPGLTVAVGPECVGCGTCVDVCHVRAISLVDGQAHILERCKGCGRCASVCPNGAITLGATEDVDILNRLLARVERYTGVLSTVA
jgi:ferredoxin